MKQLLTLAIMSLIFACGTAPAQGGDVESFKIPGGKQLRIHCIVHGTLALEYGDMTIAVDPVASYGGKDLDYSAFGKADIILVSHEHGDHLSAEAIEALSDGDTRLYVNAKSAEALGKGEVLANGDVRSLGDGVSVTAVPAYNVTPGRLNFHPKGNGNGFIFDFNGFRVYIAGDTEPIEEMKDFGRIDVAFLPVNQPYTMTVGQCVEAAKAISPKVLVPYHTGNTDTGAIKTGLDGSGIEVRLHESLR